LKLEHSGQSPEVIRRIKLRIKFLLQELSGFVPKYQLKKILGSFAVLFGFATTSNAQFFIAPVENPFGLIAPSSYIQFPEIADLDNDGDLDILIGRLGDIAYYENTGTASAPAYAAPVVNPFGIVPSGQIDVPTFADLDLDGDLDLLLGQYYGAMTYYENIGSATAPAYDAGVPLPFGLTATYGYAFPEFADIDGDGDMDLLVGEYDGNLQYFENIGNVIVPSFAAPVLNPFGLTAGYEIVSPDFADVDDDGDLDLLIGEYYGNLQYYENTGTVTSPTFAASQQNPFGLTPTDYFAFPAIADLDNDGDMDVMVSEYYGAFQYFENDENADTDGDGITDYNEFNDGTDGADPCDPAQLAGYTGYDATNAIWAAADCDVDGATNGDEVTSGTDPYVSSSASIAESTINGSIDPNPFSDILDFNFDQDVVRAEFVNLAGQIVLSIENPKAKVDVSSLDPGVYIVKCTHLNERHSKHKLQKL
jgi:hypothetical protein